MAKLTTMRSGLRAMDSRSIKPPAKVGAAFYSSPEWIELRNRVRRDAKGRCQKQGCAERGLYVDHIVEISDGGARLDRSNCELLCASHHQLKTQRERAKRSGIR